MFDAFGRLGLAAIRSMMLMIAVIMLVDYMIANPVKKERSGASVVLPFVLLIGREGLRWDK